MGRVFISHATDDARWAEAACRALEEAGITCWIAPRDVPAGSDWAGEIVRAIRGCGCLVLVHSKFTGGSATTVSEVREAHTGGKPIVVLSVDGAEFGDSLSLLLGGSHRLDASRPPREARLRELAGAVTTALEGSGGVRVRRGETPGHVGPYRLISRIGEGGFGEVWLAERREPHVQRVALKIIKPGMDTKAVIARFEQERQALAVMDHPNVSKVFDAGETPQGRPYFVMEYVDGRQITDYCDEHQLTLKERLELFIPVCEAVQHAHTKAIIHRDIKPGNILVASVDGRPVPKVIDFGVAKAISHAMTARTLYTEQGVLLGTPEYMSPEQASMGKVDVDTRSDVYSLGVVLYELLAGVPPFEPAELRRVGFEAMLRLIRETEAPKPSTRLTRRQTPPASRAGSGAGVPAGPEDGGPSPGGAPASDEAAERSGAAIASARRTDLPTLAQTLRRELEWIPLMAMEKDRGRRYASPLELTADVRAYLAGLPLKAAPPSIGYRAKKVLQRHRVVVAAAVFGLVLLIGTLSAVWRIESLRLRATAAARSAATGRAMFLIAQSANADRAQGAEFLAEAIELMKSESLTNSFLYAKAWAQLGEKWWWPGVGSGEPEDIKYANDCFRYAAWCAWAAEDCDQWRLPGSKTPDARYPCAELQVRCFTAELFASAHLGSSPQTDEACEQLLGLLEGMPKDSETPRANLMHDCTTSLLLYAGRVRERDPSMSGRLVERVMTLEGCDHARAQSTPEWLASLWAIESAILAGDRAAARQRLEDEVGQFAAAVHAINESTCLAELDVREEGILLMGPLGTFTDHASESSESMEMMQRVLNLQLELAQAEFERANRQSKD